MFYLVLNCTKLRQDKHLVYFMVTLKGVSVNEVNLKKFELTWVRDILIYLTHQIFFVLNNFFIALCYQM